jgi:dTDP-4-dehydrorhamnose 3,5-epimerase-like enzyme
MPNKPLIIQGEQYKDDRGSISFVNSFLMDSVKRFYVITPQNTQVIRAWQGHKKEGKWFHVLNGSFLIVLIEIDNWEAPSENLNYQEFVLHADNNQILHIPNGYANGYKALENDSKLLVYSDATLSESANDDYRFDANRWFDWTKYTI